MNNRSLVLAGLAAIVVLFVGVGVFLLSKPTNVDPPPPPPPTDATVAPVQTVEIPDASDEAGDADADAKPIGGGPAPSSILACCNALANSAAQSPPPNNMYLKAAAEYCMGASKSPDSKQTLSQIAALLRGASMPSACK